METKNGSHKKCFMVSLPILLLMCCFASACNTTGTSRRQPTQVAQVPCLFIFGDSLVDNGNNNGILTLARANYLPYGVDFPQGPTGRFCNGRTVADVVAQLLGFTDYIPPFSSASPSAAMRGINFASGAAGIRDETGNNLGYHVPMTQQVNNFARVVQVMRRNFRRDANGLQNYLSKCIIYSGMGSNDYLNNYFMPTSFPTSSQFTPAAYATALIQQYSRQLTDLYGLGVRKVIVTGIGTIGCIPYELARYNGTGRSRCNEDKNNAINLFNRGLRQLVDTFNNNNGRFPGAKFVYLDSYRGSTDLYNNRRSYGLEEVEKGCCGVGKNNGQITCLPLQTPCENRNKYLFWDAFHPTEMANVILAKAAYTARPNTFAYPINIQQLAML